MTEDTPAPIDPPRAQDEKTRLCEKQEEPPADNDKLWSFSKTHVATIITLAFVNFASSVCFALMAPFYPLEAATKDVDDTTIGFIFGVFELTIFVFSPIFGSTIGHFGSKFLFVTGSFVAGACGILFGFVDRTPRGVIYIFMCFILRIVQAIGCAAFSTASFAIGAREFPTKIATVIGVLETCSGIGMMTGPAVGGALYQAGGFQLPFFLLGGLLMLFAILACVILPPQAEYKKTESPHSKWKLISRPPVIVATLVILFVAVSLGFFDPTFAKHLEPFQLSPGIVGLFFVIGPFLYAASSPVVGWTLDKWHYSKVTMVTGNWIIAAGYLFIGPCPLFKIRNTLWITSLSLIVLGMGVAGAVVPTFSVMLTSAKALDYPDNVETYGLISGLFYSAFSLGGFVGPIFGGWLSDTLGFAWASAIFGFCLIGLMVFVMLYYGLEYYYCSSRPIGDVRRIHEAHTQEEAQALLQTPVV